MNENNQTRGERAGASEAKASAGLEGVVVAHTKLSDVDGERGRLIVAGHSIESLSGHRSFEAVCALLWQKDEEAVRAALAKGRIAAWNRLATLGDALETDDGMEALRAAMAHLRPKRSVRADGDGDRAVTSAEVVGAAAVFATAWARGRDGASPVAPDARMGHAADVLRMVRAAPAEAERVAALDSYLVTVIDHGMNASTFAARVVASTAADLVSAVVAAIGALKGPLHGGAPGPVLDMLDAIATAERAPDWLDAELRAGRRIMGMGHRIYRVRDPRAAVLERALARMEEAGLGSPRLALARAVEGAATGILRARHPDRPLLANVEFYTAVLLDAIGLPRALFTPMFAVSRVAGWCAHVAEQRDGGRLIRPASRYVGPPVVDTPPA